MLPPPITSASPTPVACTSTSSRASVSTVGASRPNSAVPISPSPESFSSTRWKADALRALGWAATIGSAERVPDVVDELEPTLLERLGDGEARLVDPGLLAEHRFREEALVQ